MTQTMLMMSFKEEIEELFSLLSTVEYLQNLLFSRIRDPNLLMDENTLQGGQLRRAETFAVADRNYMKSKMTLTLTWWLYYLFMLVTVSVLAVKTAKGVTVKDGSYLMMV